MNKYDYKDIQPFKWFVLENFPFIEADFDALTNWQLFGKIGKEINKIIDSQNEVGNTVEIFTQNFVNLYNYVHDFFVNLDVQEEINNKLDEMVEDGTLESILLNYSNTYRIFATTTDMINNPTLINNNMKIKTMGYYDINDNGGAEFYVTDTEPENDFYLELNNLYVVMIQDENTNIKQFGAKGDNTQDDSDYIQLAINKLKGNILNVPNGYYKITKTINVKTQARLIGSDKTMYSDRLNVGSVFVRTGNFALLSLAGDEYSVEDGHGVSDIEISNITFESSNDGIYWNMPYIYTMRCLYTHFKNLIFREKVKAIYFDKGTFDCRIMNCDFVGNDIETAETVTDDYHNATWYGINELMFYGCRFEGTFNDSVITLGGHTREIFMFGTKFEVVMPLNSSIIKCNNDSKNADIYMYGTRITLLPNNNGNIFNFKGTSRSLFDMSCVDQSTSLATPYFKIDDTSSIKILFYVSNTASHYTPNYYIENTNDNINFNFDSNILTSSYYDKSLFSSPELMNKSNTILDITTTSSTQNYSNKISLSKQGGTPNTYELKPRWDSYTNNKTTLDFNTPEGLAFRIVDNEINCNKGLKIPYLSEQYKSIRNGDFYINNYTGNIPFVVIGIDSTSRRIGWSDTTPSSGNWNKGNIVFNTNPSAGGYAGWICTASGTPGTWKGFGLIES